MNDAKAIAKFVDILHSSSIQTMMLMVGCNLYKDKDRAYYEGKAMKMYARSMIANLYNAP